MIKVILISEIVLPYSKIGSWTTLYDNYLSDNPIIDILICPEPEKKYSHIIYQSYKKEKSLVDKVKLKFKFQSKWKNLLTALQKVIQPETQYIIHIIDNYGLCMAVANYLENKKIRNKFYLHFFYHGFPVFENESLYSNVDEVTLLTYESYKEIRTNVNTFPCRFSILHNGIDTTKFFTVSNEIKEEFRTAFGINNKKIFIWCSQDRPKKGLHIILDAWQKLYKRHDNIELWIVGTEKKEDSEGIKYFGRVPNKELAQYYQASDVYLFSTLCQEGFGMSLIEAKHSGCYCIASGLGGVPEVLDYGKYGKLIENPNFVEEWVAAIEDYLAGNYHNIPFPKDLYTKEGWNENMNVLIANSKFTLENRF